MIGGEISGDDSGFIGREISGDDIQILLTHSLMGGGGGGGSGIHGFWRCCG